MDQQLTGSPGEKMGAWGIGTFDDDTALDFLEGELIPRPDPRAVMRRAFEDALSAEYVDYLAGQSVLVSAAVIEAVLVRKPLTLRENEKWTQWRVAIGTLDFSSLKAIGERACLRVCAEGSELFELWSENEELFPDWKQGIESLAESLASTRPL
jgi:hypothetical protein